MTTFDPNLVVSAYLIEIKEAYENFPNVEVAKLASILSDMSKNAMLFIIGNGGSASTASHMAVDLGVGSLRRKNAVRCISLVDNSGVLTATSNDIDFNSVFAQQIKLLGRSGDILLCFSASGNSKNVLESVLIAKDLGIMTVGITGFDGGQLKKICDHSIHIPTKIGSYGVVEDLHSSVSHALTEVIRNS
jgi:D-sedoheptulose 7-phosphate isomerase